MDFTTHIDPHDTRTEDGHMSRQVDLAPDDEENGLFIRLMSWQSDGGPHPEFEALVGKTIRVRIEVVESDH